MNEKIKGSPYLYSSIMPPVMVRDEILAAAGTKFEFAALRASEWGSVAMAGAGDTKVTD